MKISDNKVESFEKDLVIDYANISVAPNVYEYKYSNEKFNKIIVAMGPDGTIRVGLDVSKRCYKKNGCFEVRNDTLVCSNCGTVLALAQLGIEWDGCFPIVVNYEFGEEGIIITKGEIDRLSKYAR